MALNLQDKLSRLASWCFTNSLLFNREKATLCVFGLAQVIKKISSISASVMLLGKELPPVNTVKGIGELLVT